MRVTERRALCVRAGQFRVVRCFLLGYLWTDALDVRWCTTPFCATYSCVAWQLYYRLVGWTVRTNRLASLWFRLWIWTLNTRWAGRANSRYFCHCFSWLHQLNVCEILEPLLKSHHCRSDWALKSCSNYRKIMFQYELQSFNVMCVLYNHFAKDLDLKALSLFSFVLRFLLQVRCWVELCSVFEEYSFFYFKVSIRSMLIRAISNH